MSDQSVTSSEKSVGKTPDTPPDDMTENVDLQSAEAGGSLVDPVPVNSATAGSVSASTATPPAQIPGPSSAVLAVGGGIEISGLQPGQISVLQEQHAKGLIEVQRKASELKVDIQALDQTLESLTSQARTANDAGVNITATHTQNTTLGQTEIIVGNTQRAASGKVAPFWAGFDNNQLRSGLIIAGAVLAGAILASLFS